MKLTRCAGSDKCHVNDMSLIIYSGKKSSNCLVNTRDRPDFKQVTTTRVGCAELVQEGSIGQCVFSLENVQKGVSAESPPHSQVLPNHAHQFLKLKGFLQKSRHLPCLKTRVHFRRAIAGGEDDGQIRPNLPQSH